MIFTPDGMGDVIIEMNSHRIESIDDLHRLLTSDLIGQETGLAVLRLEKKLFVKIISAVSKNHKSTK